MLIENNEVVEVYQTDGGEDGLENLLNDGGMFPQHGSLNLNGSCRHPTNKCKDVTQMMS